jgi:hypothetical protein
MTFDAMLILQKLKIKADEMDETCRRHVDEKYIPKLVGKPHERRPLGQLRENGRITLRWM